MSKGMNGSLARSMIDEFRNQLSIPDNEPVEAFGPIKATERDEGGSPIARNVTLLMRWSDGKWTFLRQVDQIDNGHVWNAPPFMVDVTEKEARRWLKHHRFETNPVG